MKGGGVSGQYNPHGSDEKYTCILSEEPESKRPLRDVVIHGNTTITLKWKYMRQWTKLIRLRIKSSGGPCEYFLIFGFHERCKFSSLAERI
jgi:hypothetical protein